jgi:hypothetical protein
MMKQFVLLAILVFGTNLLVCAAQENFEIEPTQTWIGNNISDDLLEIAPKNNFISDETSLKKLWQAWRSSETAPTVDFSKNLIAFCTTQTPNTCGIKLKLSDAGNLEIQTFSTLIASSANTFNYQIAEFSREKVKTIGG